MTTVQLQRIIGVALLFSVIIGVAMLLIRSADDGADSDNTKQAASLAFEPQNSETKLPYVSEAIVNTDSATNTPETIVVEPAVTEANSTQAPEPEPIPVPEKTPEPIKAPASEPAKTPASEPAKTPASEPLVTLAATPVKVPTPVAAKKPTPAKAVVPVSTKKAQAESKESWVIQLASFSVKANADALSLQAKDMGYKSVIEESDGANGKIYRVRLEPIDDKQKAQNVASEINNKFKLTSQVLQE